MPRSAECTTLLRARKLFPLQFHFQVVLSTSGGSLKARIVPVICLRLFVCSLYLLFVCLFHLFVGHSAVKTGGAAETGGAADWWSCRDC